MLSLYYLFLWDPYKNAVYPPRAQSNSPATASPSSMTPPAAAVNSPNPTLSDSALDNIVEDLNKGMQPEALALAIQAMSANEKRQSMLIDYK